MSCQEKEMLQRSCTEAWNLYEQKSETECLSSNRMH